MEKSSSLKTSSHSTYRLQYHIIFTVKYRKQILTKAMLQRLEEIFSDVSGKWRCRLVEFGGEADHVHLLVDAHPAMDLSRFVGNLKTVSSRRMRKENQEYLERFFWKPYFWNKAYGIISIGGRANLETLLSYIQGQDAPTN